MIRVAICIVRCDHIFRTNKDWLNGECIVRAMGSFVIRDCVRQRLLTSVLSLTVLYRFLSFFLFHLVFESITLFILFQDKGQGKRCQLNINKALTTVRGTGGLL